MRFVCDKHGDSELVRIRTFEYVCRECLGEIWPDYPKTHEKWKTERSFEFPRLTVSYKMPNDRSSKKEVNNMRCPYCGGTLMFQQDAIAHFNIIITNKDRQEVPVIDHKTGADYSCLDNCWVECSGCGRMSEDSSLLEDIFDQITGRRQAGEPATKLNRCQIEKIVYGELAENGGWEVPVIAMENLINRLCMEISVVKEEKE